MAWGWSVSEQAPSIFLLDTNVFIEAYRRYYAMDLCPGFWECLEHYCQEIRLLSIDRVRNEIREGDALDEWVDKSPDKLFVSTAERDVAQAFREMMLWVQSNGNFLQPAKDEFARVADGWLIAYAKVHGLVVVTHEVCDPNIRKKVPIPNVCRQFGVPHEDTFSMLRALDVRFGWK
jgi:predicted nucleic acid-binding protein